MGGMPAGPAGADKQLASPYVSCLACFRVVEDEEAESAAAAPSWRSYLYDAYTYVVVVSTQVLSQHTA